MTSLSRNALKLANRTIGRLLPPSLLSRGYHGVPGRIHADDQMLKSDLPADVSHYLHTGLSAVENIAAALQATSSTLADIRALLVLPSGYGRVIRHLVQIIPPERVTACDIDRQAIRFCASEFGVTGLISDSDFRRVHFPQHYDLIFIGSLLTHLPPTACIDLLHSLVPVLAPHGQLVFTTQGITCLEHLDWYGPSFKAAEERYRQSIADTGVAFMPYPGRSSYGITIHTKPYIESLMVAQFPFSVSLVRFAERSWSAHQDVWAYVRL